MTIGIGWNWVKEGRFPYDLTDIALGSAISLLQIAGSYMTVRALQTGKGGTVQAIKSLEFLVTLLLDFCIFFVVPTW